MNDTRTTVAQRYTHGMSRSTSLLRTGFLALVMALAACAVGTTDGDPSAGTAGTGNPSLPSPSTAPPVAAGDAGPDAPLADARTPDATPAADAAPSTSACPGYAAPAEAAACTCAAGKTCDANNCYGGYYCELTNVPPKCVRKPSSCP
ncbi:MAG TPA: hypothetical protein VLT33_51140 [Labilithrix sp.]|nr:hypothetical protein [Labilithrix sp.]